MDCSTEMGTGWAQPCDVQQLGSRGTTTDWSFPMLNQGEHSVINPDLQSEFFEGLEWGESAADGAGLDMIMNVEFGKF
jgi:hypothetical protein